jgi:hypothetical protein
MAINICPNLPVKKEVFTDVGQLWNYFLPSLKTNSFSA